MRFETVLPSPFPSLFPPFSVGARWRGGEEEGGERGGESLIDSLIFVASQQVGTFTNVVLSLSATLEYCTHVH